MTLSRQTAVILAAALCVGLAGCGGAKVSESCDEVKAYQTVVPGKRIEVPDGLDPLEEFKEMPIPKAETPPREPGAKCIESPPSVLAGSTREGSE